LICLKLRFRQELLFRIVKNIGIFKKLDYKSNMNKDGASKNFVTASIMSKFLICFVFVFITYGCTGTNYAIIAPATEAPGARQIKSSSLEEETAGTAGIARYYTKRYNGRRTGSGEIYNPRKLTAAHPTLPFGTRVKVVNLANNKSVIVTVNDRCREHEESFIDLSRQAARQLGIIGQGKVTVRIIPMERDSQLQEVSSIAYK
jgi:rare lipoprotein A (peptidoglycan hydrolase)